MAQRFLFLQGVCSPFFSRLALKLRSLGHGVQKINFTVGDRWYWGIGDTTAFRGSMTTLSSFYEHQYDRLAITDIVLFGDCRPVHKPAIVLAKERGIRAHVFEEGYFRPYWITLERGGVNGNSELPSDPAWYIDQAKVVPSYGNGNSFSAPFWKRAAYDVQYNFWAGLNPILHRGVSSHVPHNPAIEYLSYIRRGVRIHRRAEKDKAIIDKLSKDASLQPFYLFPLQLDTDAQVRHHSPFSNVAEALRFAMESFALHSASKSRLLIKAHPLDPGLINYEKIIAVLARGLDISDRVFFVESGSLPHLLNVTRGVVTINSTVGSSAILHGRNTIALGKAIYNLPGLTYQGELSDFWHSVDVPDKKLFSAFRNVVIHSTQVNGGFYSEEGMALAVAHSIARLAAP